MRQLFVLGAIFLGSVLRGQIDTTTIKVPFADGHLVGTWQQPESWQSGKHIAALIIAGSGATDRDGNTQGNGKNNSLRLLADSLVHYNIATLRYDKPLVGFSEIGMTQREITFETMIAAADSMLGVLESRNAHKKIIIGHSQGSLIALILAQKHSTVAGVVSLAGASADVITLLKKQLKNSPGFPQSMLEETRAKLDSLKNGDTVRKFSPFTAAFFNPKIQPFIRSYAQYNPSEEIQRVEKPILIINGKLDLQVTPHNARELFHHADQADTLFFPRMNHVLKKLENPEDNRASYSNPDFPLQPGLASAIAEWAKDLSLQ